MIWLTWRQFRTPAAMTVAALAVLAVVLVITGIPLNHLYYTSGIKTCSSDGDCGQVIGAFFKHDQILQHLRPIVILVPAVVGIFWGAPLVAREIETGTHRMVWTQSITRTRWLATKLGVLGITSIVVTEVLNLMESWWFRPIDKINQVAKVGTTYHQAVTYQPANRYWTFQWYETSVFLAAALALAGLCFWLIRRRAGSERARALGSRPWRRGRS